MNYAGKPIRSLQTMLRVIASVDSEEAHIIPDGIYGPQTMQAVSHFQRRHGIPVTGITDQTTWDAIVSVYEPALVQQGPAQPLHIALEPGQVLSKDQQHPHLFLVQAMLMTLSQQYQSVAQPSMSGILDQTTADSLASFQYLAGLPATGELDRHTWKHLALHYPLAVRLHPSSRTSRRRDSF